MSLGQRIRAVASLVPAPTTPPPVTPIASVESDWDDDVVDFQEGRMDDTVNVAVEVLEAAAAAEKQGMAGMQPPKLESGTKVEQPPRVESETRVARGTGVEPTTNGVAAPSTPAFPVMIRVTGSGAVVTNKGGSEELAGVVAYAHRLIELVGDMLGLERFMAVECCFKAAGDSAAGGGGRAAGQERCLLFAEENGDTVLVRPRAEGDLRALRETLGL